MARFNSLLCCLLISLSIIFAMQGVWVTDLVPVKLPLVKLPTTNVNEAESLPSKMDKDLLLRKMLPFQKRKLLKLSSDLEGLAYSLVGQPDSVRTART